MSLIQTLKERSNEECELCASTENLSVYQIPPTSEENLDNCILVCETCKTQLDNPDRVDPNHWRCLNESMWSVHTPVKVVAWRMLNRLKGEGWPLDLLNMMYLEEDELAFAKATEEHIDESEKIVHRDVNGVELTAGDSVVLIKDLKVKGSSLTAKQGTAVRRISLDPDNEKYIEGKVEGQTIVIITDYVKKI